MERFASNTDAAGSDMWPPLVYRDWQPTCETLHRWTQIVGKIRLAPVEQI